MRDIGRPSYSDVAPQQAPSALAEEARIKGKGETCAPHPKVCADGQRQHGAKAPVDEARTKGKAEALAPHQQICGPDGWRPKTDRSDPEVQKWLALRKEHLNDTLKIDAKGMITVQRWDDLQDIGLKLARMNCDGKPSQAQIKEQVENVVRLNKDKYPTLTCNSEYLRDCWQLKVKEEGDVHAPSAKTAKVDRPPVDGIPEGWAPPDGSRAPMGAPPFFGRYPQAAYPPEIGVPGPGPGFGPPGGPPLDYSYGPPYGPPPPYGPAYGGPAWGGPPLDYSYGQAYGPQAYGPAWGGVPFDYYYSQGGYPPFANQRWAQVQPPRHVEPPHYPPQPPHYPPGGVPKPGWPPPVAGGPGWTPPIARPGIGGPGGILGGNALGGILGGGRGGILGGILGGNGMAGILGGGKRGGILGGARPGAMVPHFRRTDDDGYVPYQYPYYYDPDNA